MKTAAALWGNWGGWSRRAEEETQRWLTQKYQRRGWACSHPALPSRLTVGVWWRKVGGVVVWSTGADNWHGTPAFRQRRSWETSQVDFEPRRQNLETNTEGKPPNHVLYRFSLSQIPLQMFEHTALLFWKFTGFVWAWMCWYTTSVSVRHSWHWRNDWRGIQHFVNVLFFSLMDRIYYAPRGGEGMWWGCPFCQRTPALLKTIFHEKLWHFSEW